MTKSLRSMKEDERRRAISRRIEGNTGGLGFWGAKDAQSKRVKELREKAIKELEKER